MLALLAMRLVSIAALRDPNIFLQLATNTTFPHPHLSPAVELHQRTVRIYRPAKTANSSGRAGTQHWRVNFDLLQGSDRWENPLMGWASTADYVHNLSLNFKTKEDAIHFVEKQGWNYYVVEPNRVKVTPKSYAANYAYIPTKLRVHHTK